LGRSTLLLALWLASCAGGPQGGGKDTDAPDTDGALVSSGDRDHDGATNEEDCDDDDPAVHPGSAELCNGVDDDCDALVDDADDSLNDPAAVSHHRDADGDTFGASESRRFCADPGAGWTLDATDCDDASAAVHPGGTEVPYNGLDDDCAGGDACDLDGDGADSVTALCGGADCDDGDPLRSPAATEVCNGVDDDCDGALDHLDPGISASELVTVWRDADRDGQGDAGNALTACPAVRAGYVDNPNDCDDADDAVFFGAVEVCNTVDDDCDARVDDADADVVVTLAWYADDDGDGHAGDHPPVYVCARPARAARVITDCDDTNAQVYPGAADAWHDGVDANCDGANDYDQDGDGWLDLSAPGGVGVDCDDADILVNPDAQEVCGGGDEDCDGLIDDADASVAVAGLWGLDEDGDGAVVPDLTWSTCAPPVVGAVAYDAGFLDCDDGQVDAFPGAAYAESVASCMLDADGDGWGARAPGPGVEPGTDCDDAAYGVHPQAPEVWYDGVDQDCVPSTEWDRDGDGHLAPGAPGGGDDCADQNATAHPGGVEIPNDGVDQDCLGGDLVQCPRGAATQTTSYSSCAEVQAQGCVTGIYWVLPPGVWWAPYGEETQCDQDTDGGGWNLAAVVSVDGTESWDWTHAVHWTDNGSEFGSVHRLDEDYRAQAFFAHVFTDVLFIHRTSGVWAAYHDVDAGTRSFGAWIKSLSPLWTPVCYAGRSGYPMSAGTLTVDVAPGATGNGLCSTDLFISPEDQAGTTQGCGTPAPDDAYGPAWSSKRLNSMVAPCPMHDPGTASSLGPSSLTQYWNYETVALGFAGPLGLNSALVDTMEIYVR
jgi:hypothetical protein